MKRGRTPEEEALSKISAKQLMEHMETIAQWVRLSGSLEERQAFDYIETTLKGYGLKPQRYEFDALIGYPQHAELRVTSPETRSLECITAALAPPTPTKGIEGEVAYAHEGREDTLSKIDLRGKIALLDGFFNPRVAKATEEHGAIAQIFINDDQLHEGIVSVVWGTPTPETAHLLPKTPTVAIRAADGAYVKELLTKGRVTVHLKTEAHIGWKKIPILTADILGRGEKGRYVLLSGHVDGWHRGAMDNGSANATMLELARVLSRLRLRRGVRVAFWSGHSHGRYAGSAWYADNFWGDVYENCVAHVNVDSPGAVGATVVHEAYTTTDVRSHASAAVERVTGQRLEGRRFGRAGDQSFWGVGIPSAFMSLSEQPRDPARPPPSFLFGPTSGGLGWWWHTPHDTPDKIDPDNLVRDAKVYLLTVLGLCNSPILPFDYEVTVAELTSDIQRLQEKCGNRFDLTPLLREVEALRMRVATLNRKARTLQRKRRQTRQVVASGEAVVNDALMALGRTLIPIIHTRVGQFDHDLAVPLPPVPVLAAAADLAALDPESDRFRFLYTGVGRESNKFMHALRQALRIVDDALLQLRVGRR